VRAVGIVLLALAAVWPARVRVARVVLGAVGGAFLVASAWHASFGAGRNRWAVVVAVAMGSVAVTALPALAPVVRWRGVGWLGWRWALLAGAAVAVYGCVPETDQMREVGVVVVAGVAVEWLRRTPLPAPAVVAAWGLVAWSVLYGATGRPSALVGGLFALVAPLAAGLAARRGAAVALVIGGVWSVAAVVVARTGGIEPTLHPAVVAAVSAAVIAGAVSAVVWRRWPSPRCDG